MPPAPRRRCARCVGRLKWRGAGRLRQQVAVCLRCGLAGEWVVLVGGRVVARCSNEHVELVTTYFGEVAGPHPEPAPRDAALAAGFRAGCIARATRAR
jgi:hypothetical protein